MQGEDLKTQGAKDANTLPLHARQGVCIFKSSNF